MANLKAEDSKLMQLVVKHAKIGATHYDEMATVMGVTKNAVSCRWVRLQKKLTTAKPNLNDADTELLRLVCKTITITAVHYQNIAAEMGVTKNAVSCRWIRLQKKLGVNRGKAVGVAVNGAARATGKSTGTGTGKRARRAIKEEEDSAAEDADNESGGDEMAQDGEVKGEDDEMEGGGYEAGAGEAGAYNEGSVIEADAYYDSGAYEGGAVQAPVSEIVMNSVEQEQSEVYFDAEDNFTQDQGGMAQPFERENSYYDYDYPSDV